VSCKSDCDTQKVTEQAGAAAAASMGVRPSTPPPSSSPNTTEPPETTSAPETSAPSSSEYVDPDHSGPSSPAGGIVGTDSNQPPVVVGCRVNCNAGDTGVTTNGGPTNTFIEVAYVDDQIGLTVIETPTGPLVIDDGTLGTATGDYSDRGIDLGGAGPRKPNGNY
jgi:hypothetical protein